MEAMFELGFLDREEVYEKKRPYYRYSVRMSKIIMELDLTQLLPKENPDNRTRLKIREKKNAGVRFTTSRDNQYISNVTIWTGRGRDRAERRINLSIPQGKFLFHLPFPSAEFQSIDKIIRKAEVDPSSISEILDIVDALIELEVIESDHHDPDQSVQ
jgi:hypothetical protein